MLNLRKITRNVIVSYIIALGVWIQPAFSESFTFPVLKECKDVTLNIFNDYSKRPEFSYSYHEFDGKLDSHPEIIGYLTFNVKGWSKEELSPSANRAIFDCYPIASAEVERRPNAFLYINKLVEENEKIGIKNNYIEIKEQSIVLHYHEGIEGLPKYERSNKSLKNGTRKELRAP